MPTVLAHLGRHIGAVLCSSWDVGKCRTQVLVLVVAGDLSADACEAMRVIPIAQREVHLGPTQLCLFLMSLDGRMHTEITTNFAPDAVSTLHVTLPWRWQQLRHLRPAPDHVRPLLVSVPSWAGRHVVVTRPPGDPTP